MVMPSPLPVASLQPTAQLLKRHREVAQLDGGTERPCAKPFLVPLHTPPEATWWTAQRPPRTC
jgi:hypothetical protein